MGLLSTNKTQNYAQNFNIDVMYRILEVLNSDGPKKITNLAMHSRLNHATCKKYLNLMSVLSWVEITQEKKGILILVTDTGKKILEKLQSIQ